MLGEKQKAWFLDRLRNATAIWKIWGRSLGTPEWRLDPQNLPPDLCWPIGRMWTDGYAVLSNGEWGGVFHEPLFIADRADGRMDPTMNLLLHHGVRSALEYAASGNLEKGAIVAQRGLCTTPGFVDMGGHGYSTVRVDGDTMSTNFVCIPRPIARAPGRDGGPLTYRVRHEVRLWRAGDLPVLLQAVLEGDAVLAV